MVLYMSDLDGTLLNSNQKLSDETITIINELIDRGCQFSIATARSIDSAEKIISPLKLKMPIVLFNGVFIYDPIRRENIVSNFLNNDFAELILHKYQENNISPIVYTVNEQGENKVYYKGIFNKGEEEYIGNRVANGDKRFMQVDDFSMVKHEKIITINAIEKKEVLDSMFDFFSKDKRVVCHYSDDIYSKYYWLELTNENCTKRKGIEVVKRLVGADKLVSFGDHLNDVSMFEIADEKYAVANAHQKIKEMATKVIGSNDENGVALYLKYLYTNATPTI